MRFISHKRKHFEMGTYTVCVLILRVFQRFLENDSVFKLDKIFFWLKKIKSQILDYIDFKKGSRLSL